jgi:3-hydroxyacyl-[acyl-carrier-protein] dehydratase
MRLEYFQLIDRIVELNRTDQTIRTEATVPLASTIFEGHFPGYPLMPGVLLLEAMAQTSGWLLIGLTKFERMPFLVSVKEAKLRTFITPGQQLSIAATVKHEGSGFTVARAAVTAEGKVACNADLTFRIMDFPNAEFLTGMKKVAGEIAFPFGDAG